MGSPKRYVASAATMLVHDALASHPRCRLDEIEDPDKRWYDTLAQARAEAPYHDCQWCLGVAPRT